ncbi:MAG: bacterial transcriptional activator domain-containing protein, partial [Solirubrobacteraceae bacterium]|nr:bacterial transcriptional activator domain-containing protein [Solirubrobacteraceae bacterium]
EALDLYAGHFLPEEADERWSISTRERLRARFNQTLLRHAEASRRLGRHEDALATYRRGLEVDDLAESFYQGVMACCLELGRPAEGLAAYQRLKRVFSIVLRLAPSERSEALHRDLRIG